MFNLTALLPQKLYQLFRALLESCFKVLCATVLGLIFAYSILNYPHQLMWTTWIGSVLCGAYALATVKQMRCWAGFLPLGLTLLVMALFWHLSASPPLNENWGWFVIFGSAVPFLILFLAAIYLKQRIEQAGKSTTKDDLAFICYVGLSGVGYALNWFIPATINSV